MKPQRRNRGLRRERREDGIHCQHFIDRTSRFV